MSLSPVFSSQQCFISVPRPTQQNTTAGRRELLPLSSSFIVSNTQSPLSHSSILYHSTPHQRSLSPYLHPFFPPSLKLVTSPNTHIAVTSLGSSCSQGHRATCWWRGQLTPPPRLGRQGETAEGKLLEDINQLSFSSHALFHNLHPWISFVASVDWRNAHLSGKWEWWDCSRPLSRLNKATNFTFCPFNNKKKVGQGLFVKTRFWALSWSLHGRLVSEW